MRKPRFRQRKRLSREAAKHIKAMLWDGVPQEYVAAHYDISQGAVSHIVSGRSHGDVPWPDGSTGAAPHYQKEPVEGRSEFERPPMQHFNKEEHDEYFRAPPDPEVEEEVWDALKREAEQEEEDLMNAILQVNSSEEEHIPKPTPVRGAYIPWHRIKRTQATTALYLYVENKLEGEEQRKAKRIMGEVFTNLPARLWHSYEATAAVLEQMEEEGIKIDL